MPQLLYQLLHQPIPTPNPHNQQWQQSLAEKLGSWLFRMAGNRPLEWQLRQLPGLFRLSGGQIISQNGRSGPDHEMRRAQVYTLPGMELPNAHNCHNCRNRCKCCPFPLIMTVRRGRGTPPVFFL
jgi:hypothetical protein